MFAFQDYQSKLAIVMLLSAAVAPVPQLHGEVGERAIAVEGIGPDEPQAYVRVSVNRKNRTYRIGQEVIATVKSSRAGFLYLIYVHTDDEPVLLFPNQFQRQHRIDAHEAYQIPLQGKFVLRVTPPAGVGVLKAIVTDSKLKAVDLAKLDHQPVSELSDKDLKAISVEAAGPAKILAEHSIRVWTIEKKRTISRRPQRFGIFIGMNKYAAHPRIPNLPACRQDAQEMARVMKERCGLDHVIVLTDEQATLPRIRQAMQEVARRVRRGDDVIIFWSGHGARIADTSGDEPDGFDEVLVTHNANTATMETIRRTMLTDDVFGRWMQDFDGCNVLVILDTCHSGGQANNEKGLFIDGITPQANGAFDFWDGEFDTLTKDIGHQVTVLCSSRASQISFVRLTKDLSVMAYFIVSFIENAGERRIELGDLFAYISRKVPEYVRREYGVDQTPVLIGNQNRKFVIRR